MADKQVGDFESTLTELETLVSRMEQGNLSLEESLASFERGIQLTRQCQTALQQAELKIQLLVDPDSSPPLLTTLDTAHGNE
jgi:exodeoxyribonuclease VII small subunit